MATTPIPEPVQWKHQDQPTVSIKDIVGLTEHRVNVTALDFDILEALLRYNFMTSQQAARLWKVSLRTTNYRFRMLFQWGLVDRGVLPSKTIGGRQLVYTLSQRGYEVLKRTENSLAVAWRDDWKPKSEMGSQRLSVFHELGRNDVCIALCESAKARQHPVIDWEGSREAGQRFVANATTHEWHSIYPDAVLMLDTMQPLFIEYERSGRDSKFQQKVRTMRTYLVSQQWQTRYPREPWVIYAIPAGLGTQGVIGGSYGGMVASAGMTGARNYIIMDEDAWVDGTWTATRGDGTVGNLWEFLGVM